MPYTISTLIPVEFAGSFGDGRCCHPSGYLQIDGIRLPADSATSSRLRHQPQATAPVCTRLLCLGLSRGPRPSDCFAGYIVHPCTRCSQGSPVGFIRRMQMTTTRPSQGLVSTGLVALGLLTRSHQARLALSGPAFAGSIQAFPKSLHCLAHHPKFLRQFHQTNHGNGISPFPDCPCISGTGYAVPPGARRSESCGFGERLHRSLPHTLPGVWFVLRTASQATTRPLLHLKGFACGKSTQAAPSATCYPALTP